MTTSHRCSPSTDAVRIPQALYEALVEHARREAPNECCGLIAGRDGEAIALYPVRNTFASPLRYQLDGPEQLEAMVDIDAKDLEVLAVYHSHTRSDPVPSQTDINQANPLMGDIDYVIVGVRDPEAVVRSWAIRDGRVEERTVEVA